MQHQAPQSQLIPLPQATEMLQQRLDILYEYMGALNAVASCDPGPRMRNTLKSVLDKFIVAMGDVEIVLKYLRDKPNIVVNWTELWPTLEYSAGLKTRITNYLASGQDRHALLLAQYVAAHTDFFKALETERKSTGIGNQRGASSKAKEWLTQEYARRLATGSTRQEAIDDITRLLEKKSIRTSDENKALREIRDSDDPIEMLDGRLKRQKKGDKIISSDTQG